MIKVWFIFSSVRIARRCRFSTRFSIRKCLTNFQRTRLILHMRLKFTCENLIFVDFVSSPNPDVDNKVIEEMLYFCVNISIWPNFCVFLENDVKSPPMRSSMRCPSGCPYTDQIVRQIYLIQSLT